MPPVRMSVFRRHRRSINLRILRGAPLLDPETKVPSNGGAAVNGASLIRRSHGVQRRATGLDLSIPKWLGARRAPGASSSKSRCRTPFAVELEFGQTATGGGGEMGISQAKEMKLLYHTISTTPKKKGPSAPAQRKRTSDLECLEMHFHIQQDCDMMNSSKVSGRPVVCGRPPGARPEGGEHL